MPLVQDKNATYQVTLINESQGIEVTIPVKANEYVYEVAYNKGVMTPASCCAGACVTCAAKLVSGNIEQDHSFLQQRELDAGFLLTCRTSPRSNCVIRTHQEDALFSL